MKKNAPLRGSVAVEQPGRIANARERLLSIGTLPDETVRSVIKASWQRCVSREVNPLVAKQAIDLENAQLEEIRAAHQELICASETIMRDAHDLLAQSGTIMHLVAPSGVILRSHGDPKTLELANQFRLVPGANWDECAAGTNAIGTALRIGSPVQVHACEHFCENISNWTCSAAVIWDPFENKVLGAVNISGLKNTLHDYCLALAVSGAHRIEGQLAHLLLSKRERLLGETLGRFTAPGNDGLLLMDLEGRLVRGNGHAERVLAARGIKLDLTPYSPVLSLNGEGRLAPRAEPVLPRLAREWIEPVRHRGETIGYFAVIPFPIPRTTRVAMDNKRAQKTTRPAGFSRLIGQSPLFLKTVQQAERLAKAPIPILLQGETGVGKELFANAMHEAGPHCEGAFIALNCGGLSRDLLAGELFGYVEGAFTGARRGGMIGKIEAANGGTLFLDEIGEMPLDLQPLFLRVLQESEICRVGETRPRKVNFRLIAATNRDLAEEVAEGRFRMDLYYRISSMTLTLPALRQRRGDTALLAEDILARLAEQHGGVPKRLSQDLRTALEGHSWPGNIRELSNLVTAAYFLTDSDELTPADLPATLCASAARVEEDGDHPLESAEKAVIAQLIHEQGGNLTRAAKALNIAKSTLYCKLKKYDLPRPD
ncbi:sigma-54-dependent Fis family transcriptional regulator [Stutzerimonas stutzeri]|uniref:sigma-54-dependent Fis family transcriptional regulator n=1 Tax=Stutzerimonas stutzeri TaxID=316 RepID=UPI0021099F53|nr:sigma-54-dependent Fis family transcriptional regulator [Stutzerimonas stutzeri]MCQ4322958.1 sigma-54-dependent Fis family transcriptional regulator [Stutzerimonas stutzeri]